MELQTLDDRALVARTQQGHRDAFSTLVERYQERVLNLAYRRLSDRDLALDVAQEVFLKAYRGLDRFQGDARFFTWLFRITMNETVSARRKRERHQRAVSLDAGDRDGAALPDPPDTRFDPGAELERRDSQALVQRGIDALDDDLGQALVLRDIDGRSYAEIAAILQVPLGSVKSRIHRARQALRVHLERTAVPRPAEVSGAE